MVQYLKNSTLVQTGLATLSLFIGIATYIAFDDIILSGFIFFAYVFLLSSPLASLTDALSARFIRQFTATSGMILVSVIIFNYVVNPLGTYEHNWIDPVLINKDAQRKEKLALYDSYTEAPDAIILGSSRSFTMPPSYVEELTRLQAFNAAVIGGGTEDYVTFARYMEEQGQFPQMFIVGISIEQLATSTTEQDTNAINRIEIDLLKSLKAEVTRIRELLRIQTTSASIRALTHEQKVSYTFDQDGLGHFSNSARNAPEIVPIWSTLFSGFTGLSESHLGNLRTFLEVCENHGTTVIFYIPPFLPSFEAQIIAESSYVELKEELITQLLQLQNEYSFQVYDFSDSQVLEGNNTLFFIDAVHPTEEASRLMLSTMLEDTE